MNNVKPNVIPMKTKRIFNILSIMLAVSIFFYSCEKDETTDKITEEDLAVAEDDALADALFSDIWEAVDHAVKIVDDQLYNAQLKSQEVVVDSCPTITVDHPDTTHWPKVITIDYGETDCIGFYGNTRRGKIVIAITGRYRIEGSQKTVTLVDYYINDIHIEGTKTITNNGRNENKNLTFTVELVDGKITTPNDIVIEREFTRTREWVNGEATGNFWDDVCFITGNAWGVNFKGESCTRTILTPLEWAASCRFIKSGSVESVVGERTPVILDYGEGECDNVATVSKDGEIKTILLRFNPRPGIR
jgi:hypothetical protein